MTQKGPVPASIKAANYPLDVRENQNQKETNRPKAFVLDTGDGKMPTITLETKKSGKIGSSSPNSGTPGREPIADSQSNPEFNYHDQFVKPDAIQPDERLK